MLELNIKRKWPHKWAMVSERKEIGEPTVALDLCLGKISQLQCSDLKFSQNVEVSLSSKEAEVRVLDIRSGWNLWGRRLRKGVYRGHAVHMGVSYKSLAESWAGQP